MKLLQLLYLYTTGDCTTGQAIFGTFIGLIILLGLTAFFVWRFLNERKKWSDERQSFIEGVLSKSEIKSSVNALISKSTFDTPFYVMKIDVDKFHQIIESFGEKTAKDVIIHVAQRIIKSLPLQVNFGRLEEDRFLILFRHSQDFEQVDAVAEQIRAIFSEPVRISYDVEITISATIAIASFPRHGRTYAQLEESLSIATYTAKRTGGDKIVVYNEEMSNTEGDNLRYYEQVKEAMDKKEFILYYQPIVDVDAKQVVSSEALLRWEHRSLGLINPKEFLNILEQSGDIYWVGIWELEEMIREYNIIKTNYPNIENFSFSFNLSLKQLMNDQLVFDFLKVLKKHKMTPKDFTIELEEFIMYDQQQTIHDNINKLHEIGFKIAVDGYAFDHNALMKLDKLPIDVIKLDSSFLEEGNMEIMRHITRMIAEFAKNKDVEIVAEKIENLEMIEYFKQMGIHLVQGYFISKPISEEELIKFVGSSENYLADKIAGKEVETHKSIADELGVIDSILVRSDSNEEEGEETSLDETDNTEEPQTEEVKEEEKTVEEVKEEVKEKPEPKKKGSKNKQPKTEEPKVEESKAEEQPVVEEPKVEENKSEEEPKVEESKVEEQPKEETKIEESKQEDDDSDDPSKLVSSMLEE